MNRPQPARAIRDGGVSYRLERPMRISYKEFEVFLPGCRKGEYLYDGDGSVLERRPIMDGARLYS